LRFPEARIAGKNKGEFRLPMLRRGRQSAISGDIG
jgi:hypothetical protein